MADEQKTEATPPAAAAETTTTTTTTTTNGVAVVTRGLDGLRTIIATLILVVVTVGALFREIQSAAAEYRKTREVIEREVRATKEELARTQEHLNTVDARAVQNEKAIEPLREVVTTVVVDPPNTSSERAALAAAVAAPAQGTAQ